MQPITVSTFYCFTPLPQPVALKAPLLERMRALGIRGTITLAHEGINATISGAADAIDALLADIRTAMPFHPPSYRETLTDNQPFQRSKVKVKRELISIGAAADPRVCVGEYVAPENWNEIITAPDMIVIDTRNSYEFELGHFRGACNPATRNFKQMVAWTEHRLLSLTSPLRGEETSVARGEGETIIATGHPHLTSPLKGERQPQRVAMYCTGGIRCEKYSSYLIARGFTHVYHLHGGILAYLEKIPPSQSLWEGECFVFDERVSVGHARAN